MVSGAGEADPVMSTEELVLLGRIPHRNGRRLLDGRSDREAAKAAMEIAGISGLAGRPVAALSSGERQLAFIARALAQAPLLLFLDEPTSHLDIRNQVALLEMTARLNREKGLTVVMILHDLNLASRYCHRLLLLDKGRLCAEGPPARVLTPETIRDVYGASVAVLESPFSPRPFIYPVGGGER